jgi:DNA-binding TFAR19-related protein (PDSD5 family)
MVIMMAQRQQLREALSDTQLKQMLEQISDAVSPVQSD